ncbi:zf-TFIIB domain-containing protein [Lutimaribacter sp. EGI FJ00015]|uniref:Zf-TFIIB domain-containing protein n=1 Tax=Lutimaribacter degradans TaxID=2945989 RepID=A0ACC5ZYK2_9RHOB|nr:zf-TFIIB domain-containing protein [Lutimaribacter sp. EGI FJ00013]MCM2563260.1 zf-TFIIB domain-containing protein [Lutimaribacter sp. EGI FJ00013]MCO0614417.1 zf-TFIIB domain-containing protein [Lutimaribacter sp. EGI FJ00015]MCO0635982.1 zf-TFIIB domain-containing protein [Lutimaribacter sp. EGI FJ00014]
MQCPIDGNTLQIAERNGVEIDFCPQCRGVWLDRGELDKIIDRSMTEAVPPAHGSHDERPRKKKRESFLSELFDF